MRSATTTEQVATTGSSAICQPTMPSAAMPSRASSTGLTPPTPRRIARTKITPHENTCPIVSARLQVAPLAHCDASTTNESVVQIVQVARCGVVDPRRMSRM